MSLSKKNKLQEKIGKKVWTMEKSHPYKTLFFLGYLSTMLVILFSLFSFWFFDRQFQEMPDMILPKGLTISVFILMAIAFVCSKAQTLMEKESTRGLSFSFQLIMFLTSIYIVVSLSAWRELLGEFQSFSNSPGKTFLLLIASMHFFLLLVTVGLTLVSYYKLGSNAMDPVKKLVFFTNKFELTFLEVSFLGWYWVSASGLAIFLFLLFMLN